MSESFNGAISTNFVGTLVRRKFKPGQPYVQLVFESSGRTLLALSRNIQLVRSLKLGEQYRVGGTEHAVGDKQYLLEPQLVPLSAKRHVSRRVKYTAWAAGGVLLLASCGVVAGISLHDGPSQSSNTAWHTNDTATQETATVTSEPEKTAPAPSPPQSASISTTDVKPVTTSSKPKSITPTPQPAPSSSAQQPTTPTPAPVNPVVAPPVDDCDVVTVAFGYSTVIDDVQPEGTVVTPGQNGQNKVCYPNGRDAASITTVITAPVDQVATKHTPA